MNWNKTGFFLLGLLWGAALMFFGIVLYLRASLLDERVSEIPFDDVVQKLTETTKKFPDWTVQNVPCVLPVSKDGTRMQAFRLCHQHYAADMTESESDRKISCMLPCVFSVYEKVDGKTYLSRVNVSLLGRILGGAPGHVFPEKVAPEQEAILHYLGFTR